MSLFDAAPILALLVACLFVPGRPCHAEGPDRPNVVLIIADDMAWDDCGAYGNPKVRTPHIDRLAREGMRFDRAFVTASSCSPSRSSILTGRYPHNTGAEELHWPLPPEQVTFVEKLKASGYWTAAAGKWHLGDAVKGRFDLVREANAAGFQLATGPGRQGPDGGPGLGCGPERLRPVDARPAGPAPRQALLPLAGVPRPAPGLPAAGPSPSRTGPRTPWSRPTCPTCPRSARTWPSTTTRSLASTTTSARCWRNWTARASPGTRWSCSSATTAGPSPAARRRSTTAGSGRRSIVRWPGRIPSRVAGAAAWSARSTSPRRC